MFLLLCDKYIYTVFIVYENKHILIHGLIHMLNMKFN